MTGDISNHLWQSTMFAVAAGLLTVALRRNQARIRYWVWFGASVKFFVPFALLKSRRPILPLRRCLTHFRSNLD